MREELNSRQEGKQGMEVLDKRRGQAIQEKRREEGGRMTTTVFIKELKKAIHHNKN